MGLSSSQGRLLMLTSKLSDIQLQEVMIGQRQLQLAMSSEKAAREYQDAMHNFTLAIKLPEAKDGKRTEEFNYANMTSMGYLVSNAQKQIYLKKDENGEWIIPKDSNGNKLLQIDRNTGKAIIGEEEREIVDGTKIYKNPKVLQNLIVNNGVFLFNAKQQNDPEAKETPQDNIIEKVLDTTDDAEAQGKYDYETESIARKDNQLNLELKRLETQHNVVLKEYDSVKEIIGKNVERTFKLFSNG